MQFQTTSWSLILQATAEQTAPGERDRFERPKPFLTGGSDTDYATLARELGLRDSTIRVAVHRLRRRFCDGLREEVADSVRNPAAVDGEIRWPLEAVRGGQ